MTMAILIKKTLNCSGLLTISEVQSIIIMGRSMGYAGRHGAGKITIVLHLADNRKSTICHTE